MEPYRAYIEPEYLDSSYTTGTEPQQSLKRTLIEPE
jgi:hypothetical protein